MYKLIGGDQKEYGPVTADQLRQWILEGRASGRSLVQAEGASEWKPLAAFPEFAEVLSVRATVAAAEAQARPASALPPDVLSRDWHVDLGQCLSRGMDLFRDNFGLLFAGVVVYFGIELAIGLMSAIPFLGWAFSIVNMVIIGPLVGGLYGLLLKTIRGQPAGVDDVFSGFRERFLHLFLGNLGVGLLTCLSALPGVLISVLAAIPLAQANQPTAENIGLLAVGLAVGGLLALIPAIYLGVSWAFALPLIMDKRLDFWSAMETSRRVVGKHWWWVFACLLVIGLVNLIGILVCCVGVLFTMPVAFAALLYAYEEIFTVPTPSA